MATFYAYKKESADFGDGVIRKELQLLSFNSKAERDAFCAENDAAIPTKRAEVKADHMATFRQFASPLKGGAFWSVVDSGVNSK